MAAEKQKNRDVQNLLFVLGASMVCALLVSLLFIYYYGPSGGYVAGQTILDPVIIEQINGLEFDSKSKQKVHFVFDHFEFSYFDVQAGQIRRVPVSGQNYQTFYHLVSSEKSIEDKDSLERLFIRSHPTLLTANMRTLNASAPSKNKIFQLIEFVEEDYFRVQLQDKQEQGEWVYFYLKNSYREIMHIFTQTKE